MNVYCSGITKDYLKIFSWEIIEGRNFTPSDISTNSKICIIGSSVAKKFFKDTNPIEALRYE
jgi:putative ABC transport system permease protein